MLWHRKRKSALLLDYLTNRKQRTKIGSSFSSWCDINTGVPHGSILDPLLFNIFINDLFFSIAKSEICNFADENTLHTCTRNLDYVNQNQEQFESFRKNLIDVLSGVNNQQPTCSILRKPH